MIIFFVKDPAQAKEFYSQVMVAEPLLDVPGMCSWLLPDGSELGLMPEAGIRRILPALHPESAHQGPRAELYLQVEDPQAWLERALAAGARLVSTLEPRNWSDEAAYCLDPWGYLLAFARPMP